MNWFLFFKYGHFVRSLVNPIQSFHNQSKPFHTSTTFGRFPNYRIGSAPSPKSLYILLFSWNHALHILPPPVIDMDYSPASSSSSKSSSPVHHASLVNPATHSPALLELIDLKISRPIIGMCHTPFSFLSPILTRAL